MSRVTRDPKFTLADLQEEAERFTQAGMAYRDAMIKAGIGGAVAWVSGDNGMVIFTRGEYREQLLQNIHRLGPVTHFGSMTEEPSED